MIIDSPVPNAHGVVLKAFDDVYSPWTTSGVSVWKSQAGIQHQTAMMDPAIYLSTRISSALKHCTCRSGS
eukprot:3461778-Rhodomonas_salina.2